MTPKFSKFGQVYLLTNKVNKKKYVGKTAYTAENRFKKHVGASARGSESALHRAFRKYGVDNFKLRILERNVPVEELNAREIFWIASLKTTGRGGYNMTLGGEGQLGAVTSEETRKRKSLALLGNKNSLGKLHTEEAKAKMSASRTGPLNHQYGQSLPPHVLAAAQASRERNGVHPNTLKTLRKNAKKMRGVPRPDVSERNRLLLTGRSRPDTTIRSLGNTYALGYRHRKESIEKMRKVKRAWWAARKAA